MNPLKLLPLTLLTACNGELASLIPTVRFERLDVKAVDFETIDVDFVFAVDNPNPVGLPIERFDYALDLAGIPLLDGDSPQGLSIVAEGSSDVALPVHFAFASLYEVVQASRGEDTLPFALRGNFGWDTDIGPIDIAYDEDGEFPALRKPDFHLGDLRLGTLRGATLGAELDIDVANDHGSPLGLANLDFDLRAAGNTIGSGALADGGQVDGADVTTGTQGRRTLTLPLGLDVLAAGQAIAAAASGDPVRLGLRTQLDVDTPFGILPLAIDPAGNVTVRE